MATNKTNNERAKKVAAKKAADAKAAKAKKAADAAKASTGKYMDGSLQEGTIVNLSDPRFKVKDTPLRETQTPKEPSNTGNMARFGAMRTLGSGIGKFKSNRINRRKNRN